jgi:hypothetical protein
MITLAECGSEGVACEFDGDVKICGTVIPSIDATGQKLPLLVVCRGKTTRCETDLHRHLARRRRSGKLILTHYTNERTNEAVACECLEWLWQRLKGQNLFLLWEFAAHHGANATAKAGLTDEWRPRDLHLLASLKMRDRGLFDEE